MMLRNAIDEAEEQLIALDRASARLFAPYQAIAASPAVHAISKLGDQPELRTIAGAILALGTALADDRMVRAGSRMLIAHEAATAVKDSVKLQVDRKRPRSAVAGEDARPHKGHSSEKELSSFPSGHSAGAIAAARAFSREYPEYGVAAVAAAAAIAALQVPRSAHYPSDVAAGLAIGLVVEAGINALWNLARMDERSVGEE